jgi:hypothetical protein
MVEWRLLFVEDVSAQILGSLVVVQLCLVCVAAVLGETELRLAPIDRGDRRTVIGAGGAGATGAGAVGVECYLSFVESLLVAVGPDLFALGDALVEIDQCLFLIELVLLAGSRVAGGTTHLRSP